MFPDSCMNPSKTPPNAVCLVCAAPAGHCGSKGQYHFYRCGACGLLFVWPLPGDNLDLYSEDYFAGAEAGFGYVDYDQDKAAMASTFEAYLALLASGRPGRGALLDVGAATGFFLELARADGWNSRGIEPSHYASRIAKKKGLAVDCGVVEELTLPDASFDVVTMWDVIEHLPDPRRSLAAVFRLLHPNGTLAVNTPDSGSLLARVLGLRWHLVVPPEHLVLFSQKSLRLLLEEAGFEVTLVRRIGKRFTIQYVLETLARWQGLRLWRQAEEMSRRWGVGKWGIGINLRDNMFLLARKAR